MARSTRYSPYTGGPDPLAPPVDLREALEAIGQDVMEGTSPRRALSELLRRGSANMAGADKLAADLQPFFGIVGVATTEDTPFGSVECKARNPLAVKSLMNILGMPSGACRRPLGKMTRAGLQVVLDAAHQVYENDPANLAPVGEFFGVDVEARLRDDSLLEQLVYTAY